MTLAESIRAVAAHPYMVTPRVLEEWATRAQNLQTTLDDLVGHAMKEAQAAQPVKMLAAPVREEADATIIYFQPRKK